MRIAFVTPEFVTEYADGGGLGNYLNRMTKLLVEFGHDVELFVPSDCTPSQLDVNGVKVNRVSMFSAPAMLRMGARMLSWTGMRRRYGCAWDLYYQSQLLANAVERRHQVSPFQLVQSADYFAVGLQIRKHRERTHVVRCSCASDLYNRIDGRTSRNDRIREEMEIRSLMAADLVYAPSKLVADHYTKTFNLDVRVVRPPIFKETDATDSLPFELPNRYLLHFGQQMRRKGTEWLVDSLQVAFSRDVSINVVFLGRSEPDFLEHIKRRLSQFIERCTFLPAMPKPQVLNVLHRSVATVQPSLVDNLPNTVIESLHCGIPVIGTRGASIDELVEDGQTGYLVAPHDVEGLAKTIVDVWRGQGEVVKGFAFQELTSHEWQPESCVNNLVQLASTPQ